MPGPTDFAKFVPGFDFLQGLVKTAGQTLPGMGQWIAPTLDPVELEKRIEQLRTVQFWLEQNARLLGATIQALEVQRMTLSTLKTMNVPMDGLRDAFTLRPAAADPFGAAAGAAATAAPVPAPAPAPEAPSPSAPPPVASAARRRKAGSGRPATGGGPGAAAAGVVDPMQWWGALTQQFTQLAAQALKDNAPDAARPLTDRMADGVARAGDATAAGSSAVSRAVSDVVRRAAPTPAPTAKKSGARGTSSSARRRPAGR